MALVCSCATTQLVLRGTGSLSLVGGAGRPPGERAAEMPVATTAPAGVQGPGRPGLPGELVSRILSKVDPLDSATLAAAAAVCRAWRPWATERLYAYCRPPLSKLDSLAAFWESQYPSGDDAPSASLLLDAPRLQHAVRLDGLFPLPPAPSSLPDHPLKTLDLSLLSHASAAALHRLALHSPPASALVTAKDYRHMAGGSLAALLTRSPRLLRLVLPESYGEDRLSIDDFFLSLLPTTVPLLAHLAVYDNGHVTDRGLPPFSQLPLRSLHLAVVPWRVILAKLLSHLPPTLESLGMGKLKARDADQLVWFLRDHPSMNELDLPHAEPGFFAGGTVARLLDAAPALERLGIEVEPGQTIPPPPPAEPEPQPAEGEQPDADPGGAEQLQPPPVAAPAPQEPEPHYLSGLLSPPPSLTHLRVAGHALPPDLLPRVLPQLVALDARGCGAEVAAAFAAGARYPKLRMVDVRGCEGVEREVVVAACPALERVFVGEIRQGDGLREWGAFGSEGGRWNLS